MGGVDGEVRTVSVAEAEVTVVCEVGHIPPVILTR